MQTVRKAHESDRSTTPEAEPLAVARINGLGARRMIEVKDYFFSSVEGHVASRPGPDNSTSAWIGCSYVFVNGSPEIKWDTELVVKIPASNISKYLPTWSRLVESEALKVRTEKDYDAFVAKQEAASKAEGEAIAKHAEAEAKRAKAAADDAANLAKFEAKKVEDEQRAKEQRAKDEVERNAREAEATKQREAEAEERARTQASARK